MIADDPGGVGSRVAKDFEVLRDAKTDASSLSNRSPRETLAKLLKTSIDLCKFQPQFRKELGRVVDSVGVAAIVCSFIHVNLSIVSTETPAAGR